MLKISEALKVNVADAETSAANAALAKVFQSLWAVADAAETAALTAAGVGAAAGGAGVQRDGSVRICAALYALLGSKGGAADEAAAVASTELAKTLLNIDGLTLASRDAYVARLTSLIYLTAVRCFYRRVSVSHPRGPAHHRYGHALRSGTRQLTRPGPPSTCRASPSPAALGLTTSGRQAPPRAASLPPSLRASARQELL